MQFQSTRPRGARPTRSKRSGAMDGFNPRAHAGRDDNAAIRLLSEVLFQSTRPRGARRKQFPRNINLFLFQSTRPRGARHSFSATQKPGLLFQSTRPRGARLRLCQQQFTVACFNPRAHAGRDCLHLTNYKY